jgi:hypothetical protein
VFEGDGCGSWETTRGSKGTVSEKIMEISHLGGDILVSTWSARRAATGPEFQERPKKRVATGREYLTYCSPVQYGFASSRCPVICGTPGGF